MLDAISTERWQEAQKGEAEFWTGGDRRILARQLDRVYMAALGITEDEVKGLLVLDIGGGPLPLAALFNLPLAGYTVVDPLPVQDELPYRRLTRVQQTAEDYRGFMHDEVWGYNVLQHVMDPAAVLDTARAHALKRVRWFDWTDTPIESHHPHSIDPDWLREQFADWRIVSDQRQSIPVGLSHPQSYVAIVAERP